MSRRKQFHDYYRSSREQRTSREQERRLMNEREQTTALRPPTSLLGLLSRGVTTAAADAYSFKGNQFVEAMVVRADLNGYSKWANDRTIEGRVALLDEFFSHVIAELDAHGGVYFRDEGDCVVAIFSSYFDPYYTPQKAKDFCKRIVGRTYGPTQVTAKCVVAGGPIAIYQKAHEAGSDDWSAEGDPFVKAARLEQAVPSKACVFYFADELTKYLPVNPNETISGIYFWSSDTEKMQVPGLSLDGGWANISVLEHIPGGRTL